MNESKGNGETKMEPVVNFQVDTHLASIPIPKTRYSRAMLIETENGPIAVAVNGSIAAIVPVSGTVSGESLISLSPIQVASMKLPVRVKKEGNDSSFRSHKFGIGVGDEIVIRDSMCPPSGGFPPIENAIPTPDGTWSVIHIDANLLHKIAKAITDDSDRPYRCVSILIPPETNEAAEHKRPAICVVGEKGIGLICALNWDKDSAGVAEDFNRTANSVKASRKRHRESLKQEATSREQAAEPAAKSDSLEPAGIS